MVPSLSFSRRRGIVILAIAAGLCTHSSTVFANGRFPHSQRLLEDPSDPRHLLLGATYGILTTWDRGQHWYDFCEALFAGDSAYIGDPLVDLVGGSSDGGTPLAALVDVQKAISRSADFCGWTPTLGSFTAPPTVEDFAVDRAHRETVVAVVSTRTDGGVRIALEESTDAGVTWHAIGTPLPVQTAYTVDLDPSDPTHIYATGLVLTDGGLSGVFLKSLDHGATWTSTPIPNTDDNNAPYIAAIDPRDPNRIFVRTDSYSMDNPAELSANDALLYSSDGGATWKELIRQTAKLLGFALSPDGTAVLAGYGDPRGSTLYVDPTVTGIYMASTSDLSFSRLFADSVTCLTWVSSGVYACTTLAEGNTYEELAFFGNTDLVADGGAPTYLMKLDDVLGPPPCCAAAAAACDLSALCMTYPFFACADAGATAESCADAGPLVDAAGAEGDAAPTAPPRAGSSGCACRTVASRAEDGPRGMLWSVSLLAALGARRWRRPRTSPRTSSTRAT